MGDYGTAAQYFQQVAPIYSQEKWSYIQAEMLRVYARCLKELHRKDEFMRVTLSLLSKVIAKGRERAVPAVRFRKDEPCAHWLDEDAIDLNGTLAELVAFSETLPYNFSAQLTDFFGDVVVSPEIIHLADRDGFQLHLQFRHLLGDELTLDRIRVRLTDPKETSPEIWLDSPGKVTLFRGVVKVTVQSNVCV